METTRLSGSELYGSISYASKRACMQYVMELITPDVIARDDPEERDSDSRDFTVHLIYRDLFDIEDEQEGLFFDLTGRVLNGFYAGGKVCKEVVEYVYENLLDDPRRVSVSTGECFFDRNWTLVQEIMAADAFHRWLYFEIEEIDEAIADMLDEATVSAIREMLKGSGDRNVTAGRASEFFGDNTDEYHRFCDSVSECIVCLHASPTDAEFGEDV